MPVVAVVNRKGGSGKSTLAAHIAAWCARHGSAVMLGDVDRQQSARAWLKRRDPALPAIAPWGIDQKNMLRVPTGISHVVLDTPGGMHGFELARVVMFADVIVMPVCGSVFDRESAAACYAELSALPRIMNGRCRVATLGMRIDGRTRAGETLRAWSEALGLPYLGSLRETQLYVRSLEKGLTIFDLPTRTVATDLAQWEAILAWLQPQLFPTLPISDSATAKSAEPVVAKSVRPAKVATPLAEQDASPERLGSSRPSSLMPAQEAFVHGSRLLQHSAARAVGIAGDGAKQSPARSTSPSELTHIPRFLKQNA